VRSIKAITSTKKKIYDTIEKNQRDISIQEIADISGISRETVSKYVGILEAEGKIKLSRLVGKAKLYELKRKK
jgi:predicted transcriptional regulator